MCRAVCNLIILQLLLDFFVGAFLLPRSFSFLIGNSTTETPHRTKVRFQNEENAPVVLPNKKFLFSKDESRREKLRDTANGNSRQRQGVDLGDIPGCLACVTWTRNSRYKRAWDFTLSGVLKKNIFLKKDFVF